MAFKFKVDKTLRDWMQSRNMRNTVEWNTIIFTHSPEAEFSFNQFTVCTSVSDPELANNTWIWKWSSQ